MPSAKRPLPLAVRGNLFTGLGAMEGAGLPPDKALATLKFDSLTQPRVDAARKMIVRGQDMALAGEKSGLFDKLEARLVRAAINAGSPARLYRRLGELYGTRAAQISAMKSKLWMPGLTLLVALITNPLPGLVMGKIGMGGYLWKVIWPIALIYALVRAALNLPQWLRDSSVEESVDALLMQLPIFGRMHVRKNARDFFESLALMLEAGIPMLDALPPAIDTITNTRLRRQFESMHAAVEGGATFAQGLAMLPQVGEVRVLSFAQSGEASGTLPEMLFRHVDMENEAINQFHIQLTVWIPRVVYALVTVWVAFNMISGGSLMTEIPKDI